MDVFNAMLGALGVGIALFGYFNPRKIKPTCPVCDSENYGIETTKHSVNWRPTSGGNPQFSTPEQKIALYRCKNTECNFSTEKWI